MKRILTALILSTIGVFLTAQPKMPGKCEVFMPKALNSMVLMESSVNKFLKTAGYGQKESVSEGSKTYWVAYSDRENNTTYVAPNSSEKFSSLDFNDKVRIAKIQGDYALVYEEPMGNIAYPMISANAKCKGWIHMDKLLLWQTCLANDRGIYNKALLCVNLDAADKNSNVGYGYLSPSKSGTPVPLNTDMNFYFIMKTEGEMSLIATQNRMDGTHSSDVLFCWVPKASFVPWNQRSCLEPTWQYEDVEEFVDRDVKVNIYKTKELNGEPISHIPFEKKESKGYNRYLYRMNPESLRFPILDDGSEIIYNMSTFSTMGGAAAGTTEEQTAEQKFDADRKAKMEKMQKINLAIVIDGTSSMEPYYPAVKQAIQEGCNYFSNQYDIRVGVVIFRDYDDGEQGLVEICPMTGTNNLQRVYDFLDKGGVYGIKSSPKDRTQTEALYYGMDTALEQLRFDKEQSNIMLVVGDCGNEEGDMRSVTDDQLIRKLVEKEVHLMGFQVQNKNIVAYSSFNNQLVKMMRESFKHRWDKLNPEVVARPVPTMSNEGVSDGFAFKGHDPMNPTMEIDDQMYICNHKFANPTVNEGKMNPEDLKTNMIASISDFSQTIQRQLDAITGMNLGKLKSSGFVGGKAKPGMLNVSEAFVLQSLGYDEDMVEQLLSQNAVINFRGYANRQDVSGRDYFKPVIFISIEELTDLLKRLSKVDEAARQSQTKDRTPYINALKALVKSLTQGVTDAQMANFSNGDITNMIAGLNESASALDSYTLNDLADPQVVDAATYQRIIVDFQKKYRNLQSIRQSNSYKYIREFNGAKYYWIPIEDLP